MKGSNDLAHRPHAGPAGLLFALSVAALIGACDTVPADKFREADQARQTAQEKARQMEAQIADEQKTVRNLQEQLASARGMDTETLAQLAAPVRLQFASQSGAYDTDGKTGDDGIVLYVQPVDSDGDVIKAAGSIRVTLLDLSDPTQPKVISPYEFDVPNTRKLWYGRLMTSHFTVRCPWPPHGVPKVNQVTAVAEFKDLLTGRVLTAQQAFPVTPSPVLTATRPK